MSDFVLRPAYLREGKFVPDREALPVEMDWSEVVQRLAPSRSQLGLLILRRVHPGMFVGTRRRGQAVTTFAFDAAGRSRNAAQVLMRDPSFASSVIEVFFVDRARWPMRLQELGVA